MSARDTLVAAVKAVVPAGTHVIPYQDNVDLLDAVTVMFKQLTMRPLEQAPRAAFRVDYVLTIAHPSTDPAKSEASLDDFVPAFLMDLNALDWFVWETADKVLGPGGVGLAYDVTCWIVAQNAAHPVADAVPAPPTTTRKRRGQTHG